MLKLLKRLLTFVLIVSMLLPVMPVQATGGYGLADIDKVRTTSDTWGHSGYGLAIGFSRCQQEFFHADKNGQRTHENFLAYVDNYCQNYYTTIQGSYIYHPLDGYSDPHLALYEPHRWHDSTTSGSYPICEAIGNAVAGRGSSQYLGTTPDGRYYVLPEYCVALVEELFPCNPNAAAEWLAHGGICSHPILVTVEAVSIFLDTDGRYFGVTASMLQSYLGGAPLEGSVDDGIHLVDRAGTHAQLDKDLGSKQSATAALVYQSILNTDCPAYSTDETPGGKILKSLFGISCRTGGVQVGGDNGYYGVSDAAVNDRAEKYITGCYALSIAGDPSKPPVDAPADYSYLRGAYTWDLNAMKIPLNARGFYEDGTALVGKGSAVTDEFDLGYIVPDTSLYDAWANYHAAYPISSCEMKLNVYGTGTGNGADNYNALRSNILGQTTSEGVVPNICKTYTATVSGPDFLEWMKTGDMSKIQWEGFDKGKSVSSTVSASMVNGMVAASFATTLDVTVSAAGGECNGKTIPFSNNQVHYIIYTFEDSERVYSLEQKDNFEGAAQLKTMSLGSASFEARDGQPTTEDCFISMGGQEFVVNMKYRYCVDDYERKYQLTTKTPVANFGYYNTTDSTSSGVRAINSHGKENGESGGSKETTTENTAFVEYRGQIMGEEWNLWESNVEEFINRVEALFASLDSNSAIHGGPYADEEYGVVVKSLKLNSDWTIEGIDDVVGGDSALVESTKNKLETLSNSLHNLYLQRYTRYTNSSAFQDYGSFDNINSALGQLSSGIEVTFFSTHDDYLDYDSDAEGSVVVNFKFRLDNSDKYVDSTSSYASYRTWCVDKELCSVCSSGYTGPSTGDNPGPICAEAPYGPENLTIRSTHHHAGTCSCPPDPNTGQPACSGHDFTSGKDSNSTHDHHYRNDPAYVYGDLPSAVIPLSDRCSFRATDKHWYKSGLDWEVTIDRDGSGEYAPVAKRSDGDRGKMLKDWQEFTQVYRDVKYMDIIECHVWRLAGGVVDSSSLASIMAPVSCPEPVIECSCASLGYTLYNAEAVECKGAFYTDYTTNNGEGSAGNNAWRATASTFNQPADEDAILGNNTELQEIGRLANSYNGESLCLAVPTGIATGVPIGDPEHGYTLGVSGDVIVMEYDIERQGGRSHWSLDGFLKQAQALAFYKEPDPASAYRNYIMVQSDFLTLADTYTVLGFQWASDKYDEWWGSTPSPDAQEFGLTQAILSTKKGDQSSVISNYVKREGNFWEKADDVTEINVNIADGNSLNAINIANGTMVNSHNAGVSDEVAKPLSLRGCVEALGIVQLEKNDYHANTLSEEQINRGGGTAYLANFNSEGKSLSGYDAKVTSIDMLGYAGYNKAEDSVKVNEHVSPPSVGSSAFQSNATYVTGGFEGLKFADWGAHSKEVVINNGSLGAPPKQVSAPSTDTNITRTSRFRWFPIFEYLNVDRYLDNGDTSSVNGSLVYDECLNFFEGYAGVTSAVQDFLDLMSSTNAGEIANNEDYIVQDMHVELTFNEDLSEDGPTQSGGGFCTKVGYGGWRSDINPIRIFNPSTAENTYILEVSDSLPDGQNNLMDVNNQDKGWGQRDQRVNTTVVSNGVNENYISYVPLAEEDLTEFSKQKKYTLKEKSDLTTSYFDMSDYISTEVTNETFEIKPVDGDVTITDTATYKLTLYDATEHSTSVDIALNKGDVVSTDGTSVYLSRESEDDVEVTWDNLATAVATYYQSVDEEVSKVENQQATLKIEEFVKEHSDFFNIEYKLSLFEDYATYNNVSSFSSALQSFNEYVTALEEAYSVENNILTMNYAEAKSILDTYLFDLNNFYERLVAVRRKLSLSESSFIINEPPTVNLVLLGGKASTFKKDDRFLVEENAKMFIDFSGLGMEAGSVISVTLPFDANYANPADVVLHSSGIQNEDYEIYVKQDGDNWTWYIEAFNVIELGNMCFTFKHDSHIMRFNGSCVQFEKIWLFDTGTAWSNPKYLGTTIEHQYKASSDIYWERESRSNSINKYIFDASGSEATIVVTKRTGTLYMSTDKLQSLELKVDSLANVHKVPNANWRYYVVGWKTETGALITSPTDDKLFVDETRLVWPSGSDGSITVGELKEKACLVKFNGKYYLTTHEAGLEHRILEAGIQVDKFDTFTLGEQGLPKLDVATAVDGAYPLHSGQVGKDLNSNYSFQSYTYEFFFDLQDTDTYLFDVQYSKNLLYRFNQSDELIRYDTVKRNCELDWDIEEVEVSGDIVFVEGIGEFNASTDYISLDDQFSVYFDNVGHFPGVEESYNANTNDDGELGYGWDANGIKVLQAGVGDMGIAEWYGSDDVGEAEYTEDGVRVTRPSTECTGWIYAKYVKFNKDVYVFSEDGEYNPTFKPYNSNGKLRDIVLVEANTPLLLGYYTGDDAADNGGRFVDYGAPEQTKDGRPFVYNFWYPLSSGETKNLQADFVSININDGCNGGHSYKASIENGVYKCPDGITSYSGDSALVTNNDESTSDDLTFAVSTADTDVVGRIGALTIVDTGDPRYSDSFKATDLNSNDFLVYPLVRKIHDYVNTYRACTGERYSIGTSYTADNGSQRGIVLDPFDVRGRIGDSEIWDYIKDKHTASDGITKDWTGLDYKVYEADSYDTYSTQWFKHSTTRYIRSSVERVDTQYVAPLPLSSDFNKHDTFANQPLKIGYELYLSLESIGSYFMNNKVSLEGAVNENLDVSLDKVQIRPFYAAVRASKADGTMYEGPVDVYMRSGDSYVLINSGCDKNSQADMGKVCKDPSHSISNVLDVLYNNAFPSYLETNTGEPIYSDGKLVDYELDSNTQRRMVTSWESAVTADVVQHYPGSRSILTKIDDSTAGIGGDELEAIYTYGCSQFLFLRDRNMTYVGGPTAALSWKNKSFEYRAENILNTERNAQKFYFGLGLPSSAVFVPHGESLNLKNVLKTGYVVNSIDVVIMGSVWNLHYESEVSKMNFIYEKGELHWTEWNPWYKSYPWLVPVTYYNIEDTSLDDLDTEGSH